LRCYTLDSSTLPGGIGGDAAEGDDVEHMKVMITGERITKMETYQAGRRIFTGSKPVLKAPKVSAISA
jgi:hypothetical protein